MSVRPSVTCVLCDKIKQCTADVLIPHERAVRVVFWYQQWLVGDAHFRLKFALKATHPFDRRRLRQIYAYNVSTARDSKRVQLWRIGSRLRTFQQAIDWVHTLPLSLPKGGSNSEFFVFWIKVNFNRIKSATKFLCVKTSSGKVVV